jgi:16S rRNA (adenine1518-N6/adenine1519-N6)-dimethyltransferase
MKVRAKKALGQHFLTNDAIAQRIADALESDGALNVLEVGCGTGALTKHLLQRSDIRLKGIEIDDESIEYLRENFPALMPNLYAADFLKTDLRKIFPEGDFAVIGNFPYNISSQIFFKILDYRESVPQVVGMLQKEVAERLASGPGNKSYGILSVLLQAWYDIDYLFTVGEHEFSPPPKVKSAVIRLKRNTRTELGCDEAKFKQVVKTAFNQRRKTIRNSLKPIGVEIPEEYAGLRPEQLDVEQFIDLTKKIG